MSVKSTNITSEQFDLMCFIQNFMKFLTKPKDVHENKLPTVIPKHFNSSNITLNYKARSHNRLLEITNNISKTIVESCSGIDEICNKVRECLDITNTTDIYLPNKKFLLLPFHEETLSEITEISGNELTDTNSEDKLINHERKVQKDTEFQPFITVLNIQESTTTTIRNTEINANEKKTISINTHESTHDKISGCCRNENIKTKNRQYISRTSVVEKNPKNTKHGQNGKDEMINDASTYSSEKIQSFRRLKSGSKFVNDKLNVKLSQKSLNSRLPDNIIQQKQTLEHTKLHTTNNDWNEIIPDVYRKPGTIDLYEKLLEQLEMNDSYICFQRLMEHPKTSADYRSISQKGITRSKVQLLANIKKRFSNSLWFSQRYLVRCKKGNNSINKKRLGSKESSRSTADSKKGKRGSQKSLISLSNYSNTSSKCSTSLAIKRKSPRKPKTSRTNEVCQIDSLCELKITNKAPIAGSEKRRLKWMSNKNLQAPVRALKCLDILDDLTIRDLQPIQSEYPRKDCDRNDRNIQRNCYLKKLLQESSQETWQHLLQPNETNYDKIETVDRCKTVDAKSYNNEQSLKYQNYSREDIKRILQPYLFDPLHVRGSVITVLPVHVYYDNFDIEKPVKEYRQRIKHSVPLEECKKVNRAQWISPEKIKTISKNLPAVKTPKKTFPNNLGSKSSKNHCLRTSNISPRDKKDADSCLTKKTCLKNQIIRKKTAAEIEEQSKQRIELNMNDAQRKLWANKYGKTIGKQLIDFIDNQTEVQTEPKPKYMMPTISSVESSKINNISKVENRNAKQRNEVQPDLKKLGHKNRIVQQDIDNTIHNIEHKMNYILKNSNDKGTNESFNSMEKEIADVLTIMKKTSPNSARKKLTSSPKVTTPKSLENMRGDLDLLSDELFKKLEYILDEVNTSSESKSSISSKMKNSAQEPLSDLNVKNNYKNQSQPNKDKCSKTKYCVSSFTAITETGINEGKNDLNPLYGDQNILDALNTFGSKPTQIQSKVQHLPPNSRGDYCENLFEHEHNVQIENKNLTQYPPKKQSENTNPDILNKEPSKEIEVDKEKCEVKNVGEKLLLKQIEFQRHIKAIEKFNEIIRSDDCMVFPDTTTNPFRNIYCETNDKNDMEDDFPNRVLRGERDTIKDDASQSKLYESDENEVAKDLPGKVNKIIRRVEHVYSELEDIQLANIEIPTFQESNQIISVHSDEFLTPFMKHLRNRRHNNNNPSNDGDTEEISSETTTKLDDKIDGTNEGKFIEEHIARLYHLPLIIETAKVKNIRLIENTLEYTEMSRPSCLKKSDDYKVKKKVSFLVVTEEKGNQVDICPHHRIKTVRTSSHQFPPMDEFQTDSSTLREKQVQYDNVETDDEEMVRQEIIKNPENTIGDENISSSKKYDNNEVSNQYNVINKNNLDKKSSDRFTECSETSETRSETLSQSKSNPYILEERQINVYCDELNGKNPQVVVKNILSTVNNEKTQSKKKSKIILFRELPNISNMLTASKVMLDFNLANKSHWCKNVDINNQFQLSRTKSSEDVKVVTLLKSVYAVVYILMFTALNLEYTCVYN